MPRFGNQVVLVTGGSSCIGLATAQAFLTEGAKVAISARNLPRLRAATRSLRTFGDVRPIRGDVSNASDARRFARETERMLGPIDVLVNNAGIWIEKDLEAFTETEYDRVMDINLKGVFLCSKYVLPGMVKRRRGVIVNVSSDSGFLAAPGSAVYSASKAGLLLMTRCMALEHARDGIRVNAICPGEVRTPMMEADARRLGVRFNDYYRRLSARIPMGRAADPDEIARSILFLASDESSFMTGAALSVDGGSTAHQVAPVPPVRSTGESRAQLEERSAQPRIREPLRSGPQHAELPPGRDALLRARRSGFGGERRELLAAERRA